MLIKKKEMNPLDKKTIDNIRGLVVDVIDEAKSGHPGIALGAAPILYSLYANHMKYDVNNPNWINRDRLVLSAGHASALLYSILHLAGFNISLDDLKSFRKIDSITPGHPEINKTPGVDISTGPLGQGIANGVGMAIARRYLNKLFKNDLIDFTTYILCGDGDLMEGISYEACSLAGQLKLNNLVLLYDSNSITLDGELKRTFNENIKQRFESMNWNYILVSDGEDINLITDAIKDAKTSSIPTIIEIKTIIGKYSANEGSNIVHGKPLSKDDITNIKKKLNLRDIPFQLSDEATNFFRDITNKRNSIEITKWMDKVIKLNNEDKELFDLVTNSKCELKLRDLYYEIPDDYKASARETSGKIISSIAEKYPFLMVGSADVASSTFVSINDDNRNLNFGVREHAMGGIANGISSVGLTPVISTFLSFSDYLKPAIRMSALMDLPVIYVFTHDSISVGEDGPTHQPVEQLISLRTIPNLEVYRPADANEIFGSYKSILESRKPSAIVLSRNKMDVLTDTKVNEVKNGAYIVKNENKRLDCIIISSGEDLNLALKVSLILQERGIDVRVVSMPSIERFEMNEVEFKENILPRNVNTFVIEMSSSYSWDRYVTDRNHLFTIDTFGTSGSSSDVLEKYKFTVEYIENRIEELIK